ncbi:Aste57867_19217 [Aphanomyces stellatus]|uniref:Aste57867_19217 protein n=1 Tax=Aphanomyces stellatus TaxID=120398 RepID=A0A485LCN6_9STRA|nr:hypothetical protein As57867_019153 [Aphanomyces stellatus]VFT95938.1 Aste57867_19217 [Aphanomyces stellatus]
MVAAELKAAIFKSQVHKIMTRFVKAKPEVLRLYREILRTARQFQWTNEQGQPWAKILQANARMEIEQSRNDTVRWRRSLLWEMTNDMQDSELIARKVVAGWECLHQIQEKVGPSCIFETYSTYCAQMTEKAKSLAAKSPDDQ